MSEEQATYAVAATPGAPPAAASAPAAPAAAPQRPAGQTLTPRARALAVKRFLQQLQESANVAAACRVAGIARKTAYAWRDEDPDFATQWKDALDDACDKLEAVAWERALDGSEGMITFLLRAHRPALYRESVKHEHSGEQGGPLQVHFFDASAAFATLTTDAAMAAEAEAVGGVAGAAPPMIGAAPAVPDPEPEPEPEPEPAPTASVPRRDPVAAAAAALFTATPVAGPTVAAPTPPPRPEGGPALMVESATPWTIFKDYARR